MNKEKHVTAPFKGWPTPMLHKQTFANAVNERLKRLLNLYSYHFATIKKKITYKKLTSKRNTQTSKHHSLMFILDDALTYTIRAISHYILGLNFTSPKKRQSPMEIKPLRYNKHGSWYAIVWRTWSQAQGPWGRQSTLVCFPNDEKKGKKVLKS